MLGLESQSAAHWVPQPVHQAEPGCELDMGGALGAPDRLQELAEEAAREGDRDAGPPEGPGKAKRKRGRPRKDASDGLKAGP